MPSLIFSPRFPRRPHCPCRPTHVPRICRAVLAALAALLWAALWPVASGPALAAESATSTTILTGKVVTTGTGAELLASPVIKKAYLGG